jgi:hypothetical protein
MLPWLFIENDPSPEAIHSNGLAPGSLWIREDIQNPMVRIETASMIRSNYSASTEGGTRTMRTRAKVTIVTCLDAHVRISSRHFPSVANNLQRRLSELKPGMPASLELTVGEDEIVKPLVVSKIVGWREP